jgi:hypothetical protein
MTDTLLITPFLSVNGKHYITRAQVPYALAKTSGGFFSVEYVGRHANGVAKRMHCTLHYKGATVGGSASYVASAKSLTLVRDMDATRRGERPIRSLAWEGIQSIKFQNTVYLVLSDEDEALLDEQANLDYDSQNLGE